MCEQEPYKMQGLCHTGNKKKFFINVSIFHEDMTVFKNSDFIHIQKSVFACRLKYRL